MKINLTNYREPKPHYIKMVVWRLFNFFLFPVLPRGARTCFLRFFGAKIGKDCLFRPLAKFYAPWNFECGDAVCIGPNVEIYNKDKVVIGSQVVISQGSYICTASHDISSQRMELVTKPIAIGSNVWIAAKAAIMPGVTIAEGTVVAACSVVSKSTDSWTVVGGNPARYIKKRFIREMDSVLDKHIDLAK